MHGEYKPPRGKLVAAEVREQRVDGAGAMTTRTMEPEPCARPGRSVHGLALASVVANAVLICTGAAVRLSSSGLGCPDWPRCTKTSVVAAHSAGQRPGGRRRRDLVWLSAALPAGVIAQAVAGGIVVLTRLNPAMVAVHFLLSSVILAAAVTLHARTGEEPGRARPLVRTDLRILAGLLAAATGLMLAAGTVVTGTGPLAGTIIGSGGHRTTVPRFGFPLEDVTQLHADIGWFIGALAVALAIGLRFTGAPASAVRTSQIVFTGLCVQAVIGYAQYFSHLPAGLVWVHVATSVVLWIFVLRLYLSIRRGGSVDNAEARTGHGYAVTPAA